MKRRKRPNKFNYLLFKLVDEGKLDEVAERNAMSVGALQYGMKNNKPIYKDYFVLKVPKGDYESQSL